VLVVGRTDVEAQWPVGVGVQLGGHRGDGGGAEAAAALACGSGRHRLDVLHDGVGAGEPAEPGRGRGLEPIHLEGQVDARGGGCLVDG